MTPPYLIRCYEKDCPNQAEYKLAAHWSDGITSELKTYGLVCAACLLNWFRRSLTKNAACRRAPNEILEPPGIYRLQRGQRDMQLERLTVLEEELRRGD
jgi:hypothetical protein